MSVYIFTGPTISKVEARQWLDAVYLPPVAQGDIVSLLRAKPKVIGLIDGYFDSVPAVWHKEILLALSEGVSVVGGASMGALRAAELHSFGMVGVGEIFEWYRHGVIEADDEVAVRHAPAEYEYRPFNEALVNIRKTLQAAYEAGIISKDTVGQLIAIGQQTKYWERSYAQLLEQASALGCLTGEEAVRLRDFVAQKAINLKQHDAIELLRYISNLPETPLSPAPPFELQETVFLSRLIDRDRVVHQVDEMRLTAHDVVQHMRLELADFLALKERTIINTLILDLAKQYGLAVSDEELQREKEILGLSNPEKVGVWCVRNHLTEEEFEQFITEAGLIRKMKEVYTARANNHELLRQLRLEKRYEAVVHTAVEQAMTLSSNYLPPLGSSGDLVTSYFAQRGLDVPEDIHAYAAELGFSSYASFMLELEKNYRYHLLAPG